MLTHASPESRALVVTIHPKRTAAADAADPADWSLSEARKRLTRILPADVADLAMTSERLVGRISDRVGRR
jgi:hypothetical protein